MTLSVENDHATWQCRYSIPNEQRDGRRSSAWRGMTVPFAVWNAALASPHITVIGDFSIGTGHVSAPVGSAGYPGDRGVHAVLITADPSSGHTCLVGVRTGKTRRAPGATVLFTH